MTVLRHEFMLIIRFWDCDFYLGGDGAHNFGGMCEKALLPFHTPVFFAELLFQHDATISQLNAQFILAKQSPQK
jgi:hypothetical protein